jgi:hypothetical protein
MIRERSVPARLIATYESTWASFVRAATAAGARAWVFRAAADARTGTDSNRFIEFVEWSADDNDSADLRDAIATADADLENIAAARDSGTWEEWTGS